MKTYRVIDHTGDLGIIVYGNDLEELFSNAGKVFFNLITDLKRVRTTLTRTIVLERRNLDDLLVSWLGELLFLFDTQGLLFKIFHCKMKDRCRLVASARGEIFQRERHSIKREIKAVTYHQATVEQKCGRWQGKVIFDL